MCDRRLCATFGRGTSLAKRHQPLIPVPASPSRTCSTSAAHMTLYPLACLHSSLPLLSFTGSSHQSRLRQRR
ncbi:hypothetical protein IF2G_04181 [Cordyceps javanica]|nr:hypothetical protein IF2G_04181 [Cordyceps javanica]